VRSAVADAQFPIVLAGNCNTTVGAVSGLSAQRAGVLWFDGHADLETPETTTSGFVDGMGLAILTGHCWQRLAENVPGFAAVPARHVILAGASDIESHEYALLEKSGIGYLSDAVLNGPDGEHRLGDALDRLRERVDGIHLHIDLDVHDPRIARANHFRPPGGLSPDRLHRMVGLVVRRIPVLAASITAYDPEVDPEGVTLRSCLDLLDTIAAQDPRPFTPESGS
jgi:arginase